MSGRQALIRRPPQGCATACWFQGRNNCRRPLRCPNNNARNSGRMTSHCQNLQLSKRSIANSNFVNEAWPPRRAWAGCAPAGPLRQSPEAVRTKQANPHVSSSSSSGGSTGPMDARDKKLRPPSAAGLALGFIFCRVTRLTRARRATQPSCVMLLRYKQTHLLGETPTGKRKFFL